MPLLLRPRSQLVSALPDKIDFNREHPADPFRDNCYACHGPDKNKRKAELRLDVHDGIFSTIKDHPIVVPGKPEKSELFRRITETDPDERMPDPKSNKKLSDHDVALIKKWIEQDAPWQGHWAYLGACGPLYGSAVDQLAFISELIRPIPGSAACSKPADAGRRRSMLEATLIRRHGASI